ncbi:geranylgeranyl pyrophosphate synthase [Kitasatospora sp. NE20-6]
MAQLQQLIAAGGKRIRPALALVGWHAAGAGGEPRAAHHLAASLELLHTCALIHDDVMDRSDTRRGRPTLHRALARRHRGSPAAAERFGTGTAILVGDLALIWSDELLHTGRPTAGQLAALRPLLLAMRTELILGQYLDLERTGGRRADAEPGDVEAALATIRLKTAKYTVERPLQLGALLAGAGPPVLEALSAYAIPLGEAFQLRDDLLGVFGDPTATGKPALDDLRDGKATVLVALALRHADAAQAGQLLAALGDPDLTEEQAAAVRRTIIATGAPRRVQQMIARRRQRALSSLVRAPLAPAATEALRTLADQAVHRLL